MSQEQTGRKTFKNVGIKRGTLYLTSKEKEGEDWEEQSFEIKGEKLVRYHKHISVNGKLTKVQLKKDRFKGQVLSMWIDDGKDTIYSLDVPVYQPNSKMNSLDNYFQSAVAALESINLGDTIGIIVNNRAKDKEGDLYKNLVFFDVNNQLIRSLFQFTEVPRWNKVVSEDPLTKEEVITWDTTPTNNFYFEKMRALLDRFEGTGSEGTKSEPAETKAEKAEPTKAEPAMELEEEDKLPF